MITSRMPRAEYDAIDALNMSRLKEMRHSPQHYQYALLNRRETSPMTVGIATHVAVLEPERYITEFAVWGRRTDAGIQAPRKGQHWDQFRAENEGKHILTFDENALACAIAKAVRFDENANRYLGAGDPEVTLQWDLVDPSGLLRPAKGRIDWLTHIDGRPTIVGLKTSRDCRHFAFGSQAAKLGYHLQWAYYHDGYEAIRETKPALVEIVVDSEAPHSVAVYRIPDDIIEQGRDEYTQLLGQLAECEISGEWPGPVPHEEFLTLPSWVYERDGESDLSDLGLEAIA